MHEIFLRSLSLKQNTEGSVDRKSWAEIRNSKDFLKSAFSQVNENGTGYLINTIRTPCPIQGQLKPSWEFLKFSLFNFEFRKITLTSMQPLMQALFP